MIMPEVRASYHSKVTRFCRLVPVFFCAALLGSDRAAAAQHAPSFNASPLPQLRVQLEKSPESTRVIFNTHAEQQPQLMVLQNPARLVLDFLGAQLAQNLDGISLDNTPIQWLSSEQAGGTLRLTFKLQAGSESHVDLENSVAVTGLGGDASAPARLLVLNIHRQPAQQPLSPAPSEPELLAGLTAMTLAQPPAAEGFKAEYLPYKTPSSIDWELSGTWQQELSEGRQRTQKFESLVQPRMDIDLNDIVSLSAQVRLRYDSEAWLGPEVAKAENYSSVNGPSYNTAHAELSLRELYLDSEWWGSYWRLGKQQVVWGQADGLKVLDVVNPQSFREFIVDDFDDSRIPLWMLNVEIPLAADASLQLLWIPDTSYHEWAEVGSAWQLTSPVLSPFSVPGYTSQFQPIDKPSKPIDDSDLGFRYSDFWGGWDVTFNYLYHYQDTPVYYQRLDTVAAVQRFEPGYERNHLLGSTLSNAFGSMTLRAEFAYSSDTFHPSTDFKRRAVAASAELASVLGLDWQGPGTVFVSAQWFQTHLLDYRAEILREQTEQTLSLLYQQDFANESWQLKVLALHSLNHQDTWLQLKLKYFMQSNLEVWLSSDRFSGDAMSLFGQFDERDRFSLGFELGF